MPATVDKMRVPIGKDRRVKIPKEEHDYIRARYNRKEVSQRELAREYGVSRRLIQFIIDPLKHELNLKRRQERGGSKKYYDKDKWREIQREHRTYKKSLLIKQNENSL